MKKQMLYLVIAVSALLFAACGGKNKTDENINTDSSGVTETNTTPGITATDTVRNFWTSKRDYTYAERNEFKKDVNDAMKKLDKRIDSLQAKANKASGDAKEEYNKQVADLKETRSDLKEKWKDFSKTSESNWDSFKSSVEDGWNNVEDSWNKMIEDIKDTTDN